MYKHMLPTLPDATVQISLVGGMEVSSISTATSNTVRAYPAMHTNTQTRYITANSRFSTSSSTDTGVMGVSGYENTAHAPAYTSVSRTDGHTVHPSAPIVAISQQRTCTPQSSTAVQHVKDGDTVSSHVKSNFNMLQVLRYSSDIAAGLAYLHTTTVRQGTPDSTELTSPHMSGMMTTTVKDSAGFQEQVASRIVHRDLKPANVMISWRGVTKLSDFGLARQHNTTTLMTSGVGAGTLPYMAPELLMASMAGMSCQSPTNRLDIYSLAMLMWEMLAGHTPWDGMNEAAIITAVVSGRRPALQSNAVSKQSVTGMLTTASIGGSENDESSLYKMDWVLTSQQPAGVPLSQLPASLDALPEFNAIIEACWHHRELKRPTAAAVADMLKALLAKYMAQEKFASTPYT